jgi:iron-sulfur cluster assembly protein
MIQVTESAIRQLQVMAAEQEDSAKGLRIFVENGGCAGMQYAMNFAPAKEGDEIVERDGVKVIVDGESVRFLDGSTIDYSDDLAGAGFRIHNPNAVRSCGCGTSFEPTDSAAESHEAAAHTHQGYCRSFCFPSFPWPTIFTGTTKTTPSPRAATISFCGPSSSSS